MHNRFDLHETLDVSAGKVVGMINSLEFNEKYRDLVVLPSAERILIRLVQADDKALLLRGFKNLSSGSRFRRFLNEKKRLSDEELVYFTEVDHIDHFALGMVELDEHGTEGEGIAIGRFIRLRDDSECAEVGLTVADTMQGKGAGRLLLTRLMSAALERGIKRFRFECLPHNREMRHLVEQVCGEVTLRSETGVTIAEASLIDQPVDISISSPVNVIDSLVRQTQRFVSDSLTFQSGIGLDLMRNSLDVPFKLRL